jgi:hypothetical protein
MKKLISFIVLLSVMCGSAVAQSQSVEETNPGFVLLDVILYRPVGLAATIIGTGVFIGISPLTALASIPAPHDAFVKTGKILIFMPADYTFVRPLGNRDAPYYAPQYKQKPLAVQKNAVIPMQGNAVPSAPDAQPPQQRAPNTGGGGL